MRSYKFQALLTLGAAAHGEQAVLPDRMRRMVVRGRHRQTRASRFFTALVANNGDGSAWLDSEHAIVTVSLTDEDPRSYFAVGDHFALWLGEDLAEGVVTRRVFV